MDFKDVLAQEILAKKKKLEETKALAGKYVRRADVEHIVKERADQDEEGPEQDPAEESHSDDEGSPKKRKLDTIEDRPVQIEVDEKETLPADVNENIERRLKSRGHPIRLFGESDRRRAERLKVLESKDLLEDDKIGQKNEYQRTVSELQKKTIDQVSKETVEVISAMEVEEVTIAILKEDQEKTRMLILQFFKRLVKEWGAHLESQDEAEKKSSQGRMNLVLYKQSKESLSSFFKLLKKDQLAKDILENITKICGHMQNQEYVKANDVYLRLAIGNAPWPIGVTNVGIHERSARERISSSQIAHVLNDEATRKWLQAIKRLITFCQTKYPPALRSQMMG